MYFVSSNVSYQAALEWPHEDRQKKLCSECLCCRYYSDDSIEQSCCECGARHTGTISGSGDRR